MNKLKRIWGIITDKPKPQKWKSLIVKKKGKNIRVFINNMEVKIKGDWNIGGWIIG